MKCKIILLFGLALTACHSDGRGSNSRPSPVKPIVRAVACEPSADAMSCVRANCAATKNATFNEAQKVCTCASGMILSTVGAYSCIQTNIRQLDGGDFGAVITGSDGVREYPMYLNGTDKNQTEKWLREINGSVSNVALFNHGTQTFQLFRDAADMRSLNITPAAMHEIFPATQLENYVFLPDLSLPVDANGGIADAVRGVGFMQVATPPSDEPVRTGKVDLDGVIASSLAAAKAAVTGEIYLNYTENGCADQCVGKTQLMETSRFHAYRTRYFFGGALIQDQISIFDKTDRQTAVTLFLFGTKVSNYLLGEGNEIWLHANEAGLIKSRVGKILDLPREKAAAFTGNAAETPVAIFESAISTADLDPLVLRGPYTQSHVYGWFRAEDNLPFFKNYHNLPTVYGEEEIEYVALEPGHGITVASLATGGFKHTAIPFAGSDLLFGNYEKFYANFKQTFPGRNLVASLSELWSLSPGACAQSPLGQAISNQTSTTLWIVAASNSAGNLSLTSNACPQSLASQNLLKVAASADGETLASASAFGETSVQIAEVGCPKWESEACGDAEVGTSFAAPRLARKAADLMTKFPKVPVADIALALLATAKMPFDWQGRPKPIKVVSGGFADAPSAEKLLAVHDQWPPNRNLICDDWQKLLQMAKADQFEELYVSWKVDSLIYAQSQIIMQRGNIQ